MKYLLLLCAFVTALMLSGCWGGSSDKHSKLNFRSIKGSSYGDDSGPRRGFGKAEPVIETRPKEVLMTPDSAHRLIPIFKINYDTIRKTRWAGSISYHGYYSYSSSEDKLETGAINNWNGNFMPGFEAIYGFNFLNVGYFNPYTQERRNFFPDHVLVKTLYYPTVSRDTLNGRLIPRDFCMVSVYDEDTNGDDWVNWKDLRRMYTFGMDGRDKEALLPSNYSVMSSEYDPLIDYMYIYAKMDENKNGEMELNEPMHVFWIDLADPSRRGRMY